MSSLLEEELFLCSKMLGCCFATHVIPKGELLELTLCAFLRVNNRSKHALFMGLFLFV